MRKFAFLLLENRPNLDGVVFDEIFPVFLASDRR